ncbi:MAG: tRNA (adenosine(37)-N6)-dimethylallyltransferase MiaA [Prevotella sp.]|nr:tRNA (adenosine(37)-N6)-dimethylallyltransferase MiaA [Prevotella sp.]
MKTLIVLLGPTGVGKTDLSIRLADTFHIPIINADSRQIFAEIPIGTAAPSAGQLAKVKHYFVGNHRLTDYYSASMFEQDVLQLIAQHPSHTFLMSGGSMMYIDAVCNGIDDIPTVDDETRRWMKQRLADEGLEALVEELRRLDPEHYEVVDRQNPRRVVHALEICHMTGQTYTSFRKGRSPLNPQQSTPNNQHPTPHPRPFNILKIGLNREREELYDRINRRVDQMMAQGLLEEARRVYPLRHLNALNTVGYKELFRHFDGEWSLDEAVERIKGNTRRYMRKQLTWFKRDGSIHWFHPDEEQEIIHFINEKLQTNPSQTEK